MKHEKEAVNVERVDGKEYGSPARKMDGMGKMGLYRRPKKGKAMNYSRKAPNYQANTETSPGSGVGGGA